MSYVAVCPVHWHDTCGYIRSLVSFSIITSGYVAVCTSVMYRVRVGAF